MKSGLILICILVLVEIGITCTTAVISGKATKDGRPLLWKHRDSSDDLTSIEYFTDGKYDYIGLVNSSDSLKEAVWIGYNSAGFSIMNSASYNLKEECDTTKIKDLEGLLMKKALMICQNLPDFEVFLDTLSKPLGVEANFGVIDAEGGAAYFETNNFSYKKYDVNNADIAPEGYLIRTNYSVSGDTAKGYGYIRFNTAQDLFREAMLNNDLSWNYIVQNVSRSLNHSLTGLNLETDIPGNSSETKFVWFQDFIPRHSSSSSIVIQGTHNREPENMTTMWAVLGFPLTSIVMPCWLNPSASLPSCLMADKKGMSELSVRAKELKSRCFPIDKGSGYKYLDVAVLLNREGDGIMQQLRPVEQEIISRSIEMQNHLRTNHDDRSQINILNRDLNELVNRKIQTIVNK